MLAPHSERNSTALEGDLLYRAHQTAGGGVRALFCDIDHSVRYDDARLIIDTSWSASLELRGRGLLSVPSVFVWPNVAVLDAARTPPTLIYAARGSGLVGSRSPRRRRRSRR